MTERLVCVLPLVGHGDVVVVSGRRRVGSVVALRSVSLAAEGSVAGPNGLVGVGSLLGGDGAAGIAAVLVAVGGAAGAAAGAEHPEESTGEREDHGEPGCGVDVCAHGDFDAVGLGRRAEGALCDGEHYCRCERGS